MALIVALVAVLPVLAVGFVAEPAGAATDGPCPDSSGVTVIVDFQALGGGVVTRCATGTYTDGIDALSGAGFTVDGVGGSLLFVCRIAGVPASDSCLATPPPTAFWGYWRAARGGSWVFSDVGAASKGTAKPGSVQGWSFSNGTLSDGRNPPPRVAPPVSGAAAPPANGPRTTVSPVSPGSSGSSGSSGSGVAPPTAPAPAGSNARPPATAAGSAPPGRAPRANAATPGVSQPTTRSPGPPPEAGATNAAESTETAAPAATTTTIPAEVLGTSDTVTTTSSADAGLPINLASSSSRNEGRSAAGSPLSTIMAVAVLGGLAGAALVLRRRRR